MYEDALPGEFRAGRGVWPRVAAGVLGLALLAALLLSSPDAPAAQTASRQSLKVSFIETRPGVPSAVTFDVDYVNPDDPSGKPPAVRTVVETLAGDARFDTAVPALCEATDAELMATGAGACPPRSKVGSGYIRIDTGVPGPGRFIEVDVTFLNNANQLIFLTTNRANGTRVVARGAIQGGRLTSNAPTLPGTPPDGAALDVVRSRLDEVSRDIGGVRRGYITTPSACPPSREWTSTVSFTYSDGVTQSVATPSPCVPSRLGGSPAGLCRRSIDGTRRADRLVGSAASERIRGFGGDDYLYGKGGRDCLFGGRGRDRLRGGSGADRLVGGPGRDVVSGGSGRDLITSRDNRRDIVRCGKGRDTVQADAHDRLRGCERVRRR
jgi:hypothetical protein